MQTPLLGRELDLAVAIEQLKRVEAGRPAALLVRGEAGIGKSRLVAELVERASQVGHLVLSGRADDLDHGIPYAVFRDLLVRSGLPAIPFERDVADVFDAAVARLRDAASQPTLMVLEDLHVADRDSLVLAALLLRLADVPVLTVVTTRPAGAPGDLERLFDQLAFDGRAAIVDLDPLDRHETGALVASVTGAVPDDALVDSVFGASGGNPFFAREATQSLVDAGAVIVDDGRSHLAPDAPPVGSRPSAAVLRRLFTGTTGDVEVAKVLAVFGRFPLHRLPLVERILDRSGDDVAGAFDRLVATGIVVRTLAGYELSHPIVRDTLYSDIGPAERRRVHAAIATVLAHEEGDLLELATHVAASAEPGDEDAAAVLLRAARSVANVAPLVSAEHDRRALELLPPSSPRRGEALAMQTRALHLGARPREAAVAGRLALEVLPDGPMRDATAPMVAGDLYLDGRTGDALAVIDSELARGGARCALLGMRANVLFQSDALDAAATTFDDAYAALHGDATDAAKLLSLSHVVQYAIHVGDPRAAALLEMVSDLSSSPSPTVTLAAHELLAFADWRPGLVARVEKQLATARSMRPDAVTTSIGGGSETALGKVLQLQGRWDETLELLRQTSSDLEAHGTVPMAQMLWCSVVDILVDRGDVDAASARLDQLTTPIASNRRNHAVTRARLLQALGDPTSARALLEEVRVDAARPKASVWKLADALRVLVDLALDEGRDEDARRYLTELDEVDARAGWLETGINALRARALVERDVDAAHEYAAMAAREGCAVEEAHAALVLGMLDVDPARHLAAAHRAFDAVGAAPWRRTAAAELRARSLTVPRRAAQPASTLTETEAQLVRLVRDGLTNRQIATAMHYSPKTIEVYLSRLYTKTGCASRLELIRAVDTGALTLD